MTQGVEYERAKRVLQQHWPRIKEKYRGVVGAGIGAVVEEKHLPKTGDQIYGISVFVRSADDPPRSPQSIEGVPLRFKVTGQFRALSKPGC